MMTRIYIDTDLSVGAVVALPAENVHYLTRVLRIKPTQKIIVFNGNGNDYTASIIDITRKRVQIKVESSSKNHCESSLLIHLGLGISSPKKMDLAIQKSTELGITSFSPILTARSQNHQFSEKKFDHWYRVMLSALEQCGRSQLVTMNSACSISEFIHHSRQFDQRLVLHPGATAKSLDMKGEPKSIAVIIGPEGGFEQQEMALLQSADFLPFVIGPRVLRTETAPIAAVSILQFLWGDMRQG